MVDPRIQRLRDLNAEVGGILEQMKTARLAAEKHLERHRKLGNQADAVFVEIDLMQQDLMDSISSSLGEGS